MNNTLEGINSRITEAEEWINDLEDRMAEITDTEENIENRMKWRSATFQKKEFRIMIVKMIQDLRKRMEAKVEKMQEMFTKDLEELKNKQTEMNNTPEGINSGIIEAEEWISDMEDRRVEIWKTEHRQKNEK